jgi:hypothetical protein
MLGVGRWALDVHSLLPAARRDAVALLKAKKLKTEKLKS